MLKDEVARRVQDMRRKITGRREELLHGAARAATAVACVALAPITVTVVFGALGAIHVRMALAEHRHHEKRLEKEPRATRNFYARVGRRLSTVRDFIPRQAGASYLRRSRERRTAANV